MNTNRKEFDLWVLNTTSENLEQLLEEAREYARLSGSHYTTPNFLTGINKDSLEFSEFDGEGGFVSLSIPRAWFIDPEWRKAQTQLFQKRIEERERLNEQQVMERYRETSANGYLNVLRDLEGEEAVAAARERLIEKGWLKR